MWKTNVDFIIIVLYDNYLSPHLTFFCTEESTNMKEADLLVKLGARIRKIRVQKKLSQNDLAIECNFEKASMSRIESGQANPTIRTLTKICKALDITMVELFKE